MVDRLDRETQYWDGVAGESLVADASLLRVEPDDLFDRTKDWLPLIDLPQLTEHLLARLGDIRDRRILDLGTGNGFLAVALALRGAVVTAVDLSPVSLRLAHRRAELSGVADRITFSLSPAEKLDLPSASFDGVCGIFVLHHTDLRMSGAEIARVLKPGAPGVFIETMAFNPLLNAARRTIPGRFGIEKSSSDDEAPIGPAGVARLRGAFPGTVSVEWPAVVFMRMLSYVRLFQAPPLMAFLRGLDRAVASVPGLRRLSYFGVIVMHSPQKMKEGPSQALRSVV